MGKMKQFAEQVSEHMGFGGTLNDFVFRRATKLLSLELPADAGGPSVKCLHCGDVIFSAYRHDFVWCGCGKIAIDGGKAYTRMAFHSQDDYSFDLTVEARGEEDQHGDT